MGKNPEQLGENELTSDANEPGDGNFDISRGDFLKKATAFLAALALGEGFFPEEAEAKPTNELLRRLFIENPKVPPPSGKKHQELTQKWQVHYSKGKGAAYEASTAMERMIQGGDLQLIYDKCLKHEAPFEAVFLAIAESHWKNVKSPVGAYGRWQFMPSTARSMGLIKNGVDYRGNKEKSTDAAAKLLKENYERTKKWDKEFGFNSTSIPSGERWHWAMWQYNAGISIVKSKYKLLKGRSALYPNYQTNSESRNYVAKIFGIRSALAFLLKKDPLLSTPKNFSEADRAYANFLEKDLTPQESISELRKIREMYLKESGKKHTKQYVEGVLAVVDGKIKTLSALVQSIDENPDLKRYREKFNRKSPQEKLALLREIKEKYQAQLDRADSGQGDAIDILDFVEKEMGNVLGKDIDLSSIHLDQYQASFGVSKNGELTVRITEEGERNVETYADVIDYNVQAGDTINLVARRLSGSPNKEASVKSIIVKLNPDIGDINSIKVGQNIKVPGEFVRANKKLPDLLKEYYPGYDASTAEAHLKYLNGVALHKGEKISGDDIILVPIVR